MADVAVRPARPEEVEATHEVIAACEIPLYGKVEFTLEHLRSTWDLWTGFTAREGGGRVVGTSAVRGTDVVVFVRPDARRRGIGTRLLRAAEGAAPGDVVQSDAVTLEPAAAPFLRANGYAKIFEIWLMGIDLEEAPPAPRWPEGVAARTFQAEDGPALKRLLDGAYADDPTVPALTLPEWRRVMLDDPSFDEDVWVLAEANGELAGAALNWREGYVKDLVVHPDWRRRGLGQALALRTFRAFRKRGVRRVTLKTTSNNPTQAWRLYERLGMRKERTYEVFEKRLG